MVKRRAIVVAIGKGGEIGRDQDMPWGRSLPADLANFRSLTLGKSVVMGLRTFESLGSRPLPGRENIILSETPLYQEGIKVVASLAEAYEVASYDIFVIGGGMTYKMALGDVDYLYVTEVQASFPGSTVFFPKIEPEIWEEVAREERYADSENKYDFSFVTYRRRGVGY